MSSYVTNFFDTYQYPINLYIDQNNFNGAKYNEGERPILNIKLNIEITKIDEILYYVYKISFNNSFNVEIVFKMTGSQFNRGFSRRDTTPGIGITEVRDDNRTNTFDYRTDTFNDRIEAFVFEIIFDEGVPIDKCLYKKGDKYRFYTTESKQLHTDTTIKVKFTRDDTKNETDGCPSPKTFSLFNKSNVIVPSIFIDFQSLIDGSDIGNTIFKVTDDFQYYKHKTTPIIPHHSCKITSSNNLKITNFEKSCPLIVSILKGMGNTAWQKISYLFENVTNNVNDIYNFFINLVKYSMTKYLLSRIMYGNFNIKYVLNKYNKKFLKDLGNTRFCNFIDLFTNPNSNIFGYEQYFL